MYKQRRFFLKIVFIVGLFMACTIGFAQQNANVFDKIVIDAGHGGNKPGAIGSKYKEKDITLDVAIKLGKLINQNLKGVKVYYTRVIDQDIDLYKRSSIANQISADLFISIHCNSSTSKAAGGVETYAMGLGKSDRNLEVAKKENAEILTENNALQNYEGFDADAPETDILMSLYQSAYLNNSLDFASKLQTQYQKFVPFRNRGVHQANFVVLWKAAMPAILTEIGFISNTKEEEYIGSEYGQWVIASCIFRAICEYRNKVDNLNDKIPEIETLIPQDVQAREKARTQYLAEKKAEQEQKAKEKAHQDSIANNQASLWPKDSIQTIQKSGTEIVYRVQFMSSPTRVSKSDSRLNGLEDVFAYQDKGAWKYTAGVFATQKEALDYLKKIKEKYADAFVVAFDNGRRISMVEAQRLQKNKNTNKPSQSDPATK